MIHYTIIPFILSFCSQFHSLKLKGDSATAATKIERKKSSKLATARVQGHIQYTQAIVPPYLLRYLLLPTTTTGTHTTYCCKKVAILLQYIVDKSALKNDPEPFSVQVILIKKYGCTSQESTNKSHRKEYTFSRSNYEQSCLHNYP